MDFTDFSKLRGIFRKHWNPFKIVQMEFGHLRKDGRALDALRPLCIEKSVLSTADGSVKASQGKSCVLVSVVGPKEVPRSQKGTDSVHCLLEVHVTTSTGEREDSLSIPSMELRIQQALLPLIIRTLAPHAFVQIHLQIIEDDGSILSLMINAASIALADAGVALYSLVSASSLCITSSGIILHDPTKEEEDCSSFSLTAGFESKSSHKLVLSTTRGLLSGKVLLECIQRVFHACNAVSVVQSSVLHQSISKTIQ